MFINFTNHPSNQWSEAQLSAARTYGKVLDMPFPAIDPTWESLEVALLAQDYANKIFALNPTAVLCQGEQTFCFAVIQQLRGRGFTVLSACSARSVKEHCNAQGKTEKLSVFEFVQFREYF